MTKVYAPCCEPVCLIKVVWDPELGPVLFNSVCVPGIDGWPFFVVRSTDWFEDAAPDDWAAAELSGFDDWEEGPDVAGLSRVFDAEEESPDSERLFEVLLVLNMARMAESKALMGSIFKLTSFISNWKIISCFNQS
jgi:hypothetical protein